MIRRSYKLLWFFLILVGIAACQPEEREEFYPEDIYDESNNPDILEFWQMPDSAKLYRIAQTLRTDIGLWGYRTGYTYLKGAEHRDSLELDINITKRTDNISFNILGNVASYGEFPQSWNSDFGHYDEADYLRMDLIITNDKDNRRMRFSEKGYIFENGNVDFDFFIPKEELAHVTHGMVNFKVDIRTEFISFHGYSSGKRAMRATISMPFLNPQFYKTDFYFKSITLNKEITDDVLGDDNDLNDPRPETGIWVRYDGQWVIFGSSSNSYSYKGRHKKTFYHRDTTAVLKIGVYDMDFLGDDEICDTSIVLSSLEGDDYHVIKMTCVDEMLIYSRLKGKAN